jgi:hypothetical protein
MVQRGKWPVRARSPASALLSQAAKRRSSEAMPLRYLAEFGG